MLPYFSKLLFCVFGAECSSTLPLPGTFIHVILAQSTSLARAGNFFELGARALAGRGIMNDVPERRFISLQRLVGKGLKIAMDSPVAAAGFALELEGVELQVMEGGFRSVLNLLGL